MKIEFLDPVDLGSMMANPGAFRASLADTAYIVRDLIDEKLVDSVKNLCLEFSATREPSWHPCVDGVPDYHRLHDQYPNAYVKSTQHGYYFHPWNGRTELFNTFEFIFDLKLGLMDQPATAQSFFSNIPSTGPIARVVVHQYPKGGGGQEEHIDPVSDFAPVQTIIQAANPGTCYKAGGLYINHNKFGKINLDPLTRKGDLVLISPGIKHGVAAVDPEQELDWTRSDGRWIIMPIILHSDVPGGNVERPKGMGRHE